MEDKAIELLQQQVEKLEEKKFDLAAWKKYTLIILFRIFGKDNEKVRQIQNIDYEFNSWSLRDAAGNESYEDGAKKLAREVLQSSIDEIRVFGLPTENQMEENETVNEILGIITDEMKGSEVKKLRALLSSDESQAEKERKIRETFEDFGEIALARIITQIVLQQDIQQKIID